MQYFGPKITDDPLHQILSTYFKIMYVLIHTRIYFVEFDVIITSHDHLPMNSRNIDRYPLGLNIPVKNKEKKILKQKLQMQPSFW